MARGSRSSALARVRAKLPSEASGAISVVVVDHPISSSMSAQAVRIKRNAEKSDSSTMGFPLENLFRLASRALVIPHQALVRDEDGEFPQRPRQFLLSAGHANKASEGSTNAIAPFALHSGFVQAQY